MLNKAFSIDFKLDSKKLMILYICFKYKFPISLMLSFYEYYGDKSMFAFKVLMCLRKIPLTDATMMKVLEESRLLMKQILTGTSIMGKYAELPKYPGINPSAFSKDYCSFLQEYLLQNVKDIYAPLINLRLDAEDLYDEIA